jgi:hypothetical protein
LIILEHFRLLPRQVLNRRAASAILAEHRADWQVPKNFTVDQLTALLLKKSNSAAGAAIERLQRKNQILGKRCFPA